jgi:AcrR family transcriptional regulator
MPRRAPEASKRRAAEILDAAARVFADRGYHGATTQDIADVLGIRQASLYYYLPSKEVALEHVCVRGVAGYVERATAIAAGRGGASDKLSALVHNHLEPLRQRAADVRVFLTERHHLPDASRKRIGRLARRYERIVEGVLAAGVRSGEFRADLDARLAALAMMGLCNAAPAWYGKEPGASVDRIAREFARLLLAGMVARPLNRPRR